MGVCPGHDRHDSRYPEQTTRIRHDYNCQPDTALIPESVLVQPCAECPHAPHFGRCGVFIDIEHVEIECFCVTSLDGSAEKAELRRRNEEQNRRLEDLPLFAPRQPRKKRRAAQ